jgi:hypothetical protein
MMVTENDFLPAPLKLIESAAIPIAAHSNAATRSLQASPP